MQSLQSADRGICDGPARRAGLWRAGSGRLIRLLALLLCLVAGSLFSTLSAQVVLYADTVQGATGTQVVVPVRVDNFTNLIGAQGTIEWDTAVVTYDTVFQYGLPAMSTANFGTTLTPQGKLTYSWDDPSFVGVTVADSSVIFAIRFTVKGSPGSNSDVSFSSNPTRIEFINNLFSIAPHVVRAGRVEVPLGANCAILNVAAGTQTSCVPGNNTYTQQLVVTYANAPASGLLEVNGQSFPISGSPQTVTLTNLPANGLGVNVAARFSADTACAFTANTLFSAPSRCGQTILFADSVQGSQGGQVIVPVRVKTFVDMIGAQGTVVWDTAIAHFDTVFQFGLPGMAASNFGITQTTDGRLTFSWDDASLQGVTVPDSSAIFGIRFDVVGAPGTATPVAFSNVPTLLEFTDNNFFTVAFDTVPGEIEIPLGNNCLLVDAQPGTQSPCDPQSNTYSQELVVTYLNAPASGNLVINGQTFPITGSPQNVSLTGLPANGQAIDVTAFFSADTACRVVKPQLFRGPSRCGQLILFADSVQGMQGGQVVVPVRVKNFIDLIGAQGSVVWDTAVATFDTVFQFGLPFMSSANFGTAQVSNGMLTFSWDDPNFAGITVPDSSVIFGIRFDVVGGPGSVTPVAFKNSPTLLEFTDNTFFTIAYDTIPGEIEVPVGTNCALLSMQAGGQSPCAPLTNTFTQDLVLTYVNAPATGSLIVNGQSFPISGSPQTVTLTNLPANGQQVDVTAFFSADSACTLTRTSLFSSPSNCGTLTIYADSVQGNTGTQVIVPVRVNNFVDLVGAQGTISWITTVATYDTVFQYGLPNMSPSNFGVTQTSSGHLTFSWDDPNLSGVSVPDSTVIFAIRFNVVGGPGSITPVAFTDSPTQLEFTDNTFFTVAYDTIPGQIEVPINGCAITDLQAGLQSPCNGLTNLYSQEIIVTYASAPSFGSLVVNGQAFPIGSSPQTVYLSNLPSNGQPVNVTAFFSADTTCFRTENAVFFAPPTCISGDLTLFADSIQTGPNTQVVMPIRVRNFDDITGAQGTINWDTAVAVFDTVVQYGLPNMTNANFGTVQAPAGFLTFSWDDPNLTGVSVPDSTQIFGIRFQVRGQVGDSTPICFVNSPTQLEFTDDAFSILPFDTIKGEIRVINSELETDTLLPTFLCAGDSLLVPYTTGGTFGSNNVFTAQLSDATGSFAFPTVIGTRTDSVSGVISCFIPYVPSGTGYRIRVISSNPPLTGSDNGKDITISNIQVNDTTAICQGDSIFLGGAFQTAAGSYVDTLVAGNGCDSVVTTLLNVLPGFSRTDSLDICQGDSIFAGGAFQTSSGTYVDSLTNSIGCDSVITTVLTVIPSIVRNDTATICNGDSIFLAGAFQSLAGTYTDSLTAGSGCDSVVITLLNVLPLSFDTVNVSICDGDSAFAGGGFQTVSGTYVDTLVAGNGCDSLLRTVLTVLPVFSTNDSAQICTGDSIFLGGAFQTTAGTFVDTLTASNGCDSVVTTVLSVLSTLSTNNTASICDGDSILLAGAFRSVAGTYVDSLTSASGCDSIVTTVLTVLPVYAVTDSATICNGDSIFLGGAFQTSAGSYVDSLVSSGGCDSVVTTVLQVLPVFASSDSASICSGDSLFLGGAFRSVAGAYVDTLVAGNGCDSVVTTVLRVLPLSFDTVSVSICDGDSVFAGGAFVTVAGSYVDTLVAANGCDSLLTTVVTVLPVFASTDSASICAGDSIFLGGGFQSVAGAYTDTLVAGNGCDSVVTTVLTVLPLSFDTVSVSICDGDSVFAGGAFVTVSGTYRDTLTAGNGCDSLVTTVVTVLPVFAVNDTASICSGDSIFLGGAFQMSAGVYVDTLATSGGCDSVVTTALFVVPEIRDSLAATICDGDSIFLAGAFQSVAGTYVDTLTASGGCDSIVTTALTVLPLRFDTLSVSICDGDSVFAGGAFQTVAGSYVDTLVAGNGCDSLVTTVVTVLPVFASTDSASICAGDSIFLAGAFRSVAGAYVDTLVAANGCDSVATTVLRVLPVFASTNSASICSGDSIFLGGAFRSVAGSYVDTLVAGNGCDSVVTTALTVLPTFSSTDSAAICTGDSIFLGGAFRSVAGSYVDTLVAGNGCDSVVTTVLSVLPVLSSSASATICDGDSVFLGGSFQTLAGVYVDTLTAGSGCDSIVSTTLTVLPLSFDTVAVILCDGDSVFAGGAFQTVAGSYVDTLVAANGCDSLVTTVVSILPVFASVDSASICDGDSIFIAGAFRSVAGSYVDTLTAANGCDSVATTVLTVFPVFAVTDAASVCAGDSIFLGGDFRSVAGAYVDTFPSVNGCDSVVTTTLTILPVFASTDSAEICSGDSIFLGGAFQTVAGVYIDTLSAVNGCDSVVSTVLTVLPFVNVSATASVCDGDSIFLGGAFQSTSGTYVDTLITALGCDSIISTVLTIRPRSFNAVSASICDGDSFFVGGAFQTVSGVYRDTLVAANGCDSVITTTLTVLPVVTGSAAASICQGDSIFLGGAFRSVAGSFVDTLVAANGCDSILTTTLTVLPAPVTNLNVSICPGDSFFAGGAFQTNPGTYRDTVSATNGCDSVLVTTLNFFPIFNLTASAALCPGDSVFAGGAWQTTPGTYVDSLTSRFGCDSVITTTVTNAAPFTSSRSTAICQGDTIFLGGGPQTTAGTYVDTLRASNGCDSIVTTTLTVFPVPPSPTINPAGTFDICPGQSVTFTSSFNGTNLWSSGQSSQSITVTQSGTFTVQAQGANGCFSAASAPVTVNVLPKPVASFTHLVNNATANFTDGSTANPTSWIWDFGDGQTSSLQNPIHTYAANGTYNVCLIVENICDRDTFCDSVTINCPFPVPDFSWNAVTSNLYGFTDLSTNQPYSWIWDFGDGNISTVQNPGHTYTNPGVYTVCLTVRNDCGERDTCKQVSVMVSAEPGALPGDWRLYPNPGRGTFFLEGDLRAGAIRRVVVYDLMGHRVYAQAPGVLPPGWRLRLALEGLAGGIYFLRVEAEDGAFVGKLVVE